MMATKNTSDIFQKNTLNKLVAHRNEINQNIDIKMLLSLKEKTIHLYENIWKVPSSLDHTQKICFQILTTFNHSWQIFKNKNDANKNKKNLI